MARPVRLFVYGSLMRGEAGSGLMARAKYLCPARTVAGFRLVDLGDYPGMVVGGRGAVEGELYEVDAPLLKRLDAFEEHPDLYVRSTISLQSGLTAETYILRSDRGRAQVTIGSGSWRQR